MSHGWLHAMPHNHETNEQLSFKLSYSNYIILNFKKNMSYMAILNRIMVKYLSHSPKFLVMRWLLCETTTSFTHLTLSQTRHKKSYAALYDTGDM